MALSVRDIEYITYCARYRVFSGIPCKDFKVSSDSGIIGDYVILSSHHFGIFELFIWSYGMYRIMCAYGLYYEICGIGVMLVNWEQNDLRMEV
ncbi:Cobalt transport CbiM [Gossypium australe]|uniref:Cobalt transport CbiM n=1 Tax=Gossypium australe TaxID=47621 RepID=A0A5B6WI21_9ROSI|nr:Cobalt transport CbiM [Gossypium australe]